MENNQFKTQKDRDAEALFKSGAYTGEIEVGLLGGLFRSPHMMYDVADVVSPQMFGNDQNRKVYEAMLEMHEEGGVFDAVILKQKAGVTHSKIAEIMVGELSGAGIKKYTKELRSGYIDRMLFDSAESIQSLATNTKLSASEKVDRAEKLLLDATALTDNRKYHSIKDALKDTVSKLDKTTHTEVGVTSGFASIDKLLFGFHKSDLIILAARPSVGKTTLALDIARHASKAGTAVGVFSLEMSEQQLSERMLAGESLIGAWKLKTASVSSDGDKESVAKSIEVLSALPIFIDDNSSSTVSNIKSSARRMKKQENVGLIIIDYLQLITPTNSKASTNEQITEISRSLKILAKELNIPIIALSQLSREVEKRGGTPRLSDLRDSGSIEQDADIVMFIHREDRVHGSGSAKEKTGVADILVEKHRNGAVGRVQLMFDEENTTFTEAEFAGNIDEF